MSRMLEQILSNQNMNEARKKVRKKVRANKETAGIDGITIDNLDSYIQEN